MNRLTKYACLLTAAFGLAACSGGKVQGSYDIVPLPNEINEQGSAPFVLTSSTTIGYAEGDTALQRVANHLAGYIEASTGKLPKVKTGEGGIHLSVAQDIENPEGYRLTVSQEGVEIAGGSAAGVFYGAQTLRKSIPANAKGMDIELPAAQINDAPRFAYRGLHFDVSRHFFPVDSVKRFIDMLALHNMNTLHWHLTDDQGWRIEIKKYPKLTEIGSKRKETVIGHNSGKYDGIPYEGYYTQDQIRDVVRYAQERFITIVPEIDLPGHQLAALAAYPELGCTGGPYEVWTMWGIADDVICAGNDQAMQFLEDVLAEVIDLFPSEYIHVGGDECPKVRWEKCPKCQARIKAEGIRGDREHTKEMYLQSYVISRMEKFVESKGQPHGEIRREQGTPHHRLGRNPGRRTGTQRHRDELARNGRRHQGCPDEAQRHHDAQQLPLLRLLSEHGHGERAYRHRRLCARREGIFLRAHRRHPRGIPAVHHRRAGQPVDRVHPHVQPGGIHGNAAHGCPGRSAVERQGPAEGLQRIPAPPGALHRTV